MQVDDVTLPQVFFKHFVCKNQLPGFYIIGTLVENGLIGKFKSKDLNIEHLPEHWYDALWLETTQTSKQLHLVTFHS